MHKQLTLGLITLALGLAPASAQNGAASRLDTVKQRGKLICGVNNVLAGFGFLDAGGQYSGFDVDFCRAVAAAVLGDPGKVEYVPLNAAARFTAIQSGEVDVVFRNTTLTSSRDGEAGVDFGPITFYDGQGVMVKSASTAKRLTDLDGATICTNQGTTTEQNINDYARLKKKTFKVVTYADFDKVMAAFDQGRCDAVTTDSSALAARRATAAKPGSYRVLPEIISKEPLAPFVAQNDSRWRDAVSWVVYATIYAEEYDVSRRTIDSLKGSEDPLIRRFLGTEGTTGKGLGLAPDFAANVIRAVGNYAEIYARNLGPKTKLNLPRRLNSGHKAGGLLYSPPFR